MSVHDSRSVDRIFAIVEFIRSTTNPVPLAEIARATGLHRATAYRLLRAMCERGYLYKDQASGSYSVGQRLFRLGSPQVRTLAVMHRIRPVFRQLAHSTEMTAIIARLEGTQIVICEKVETPRSMKIAHGAGTWLEAHATAAGKAILAFRPRPDVQKAYRCYTFANHTGNTLKSQSAFFACLDAVRSEGHALDLEEMTRGINSVAVPMTNSLGLAYYALSVVGPAQRYPPARLAELADVLKRTVSGMRKLIFNYP